MALDLWVFSNEYGWWLMERSSMDTAIREQPFTQNYTLPYLFWIASLDAIPLRRGGRFMLNGSVYIGKDEIDKGTVRKYDAGRDGHYLRATLSYMSYSGRWWECKNYGW